MTKLPIDSLRSAFDAAEGPIVITAPTGSGKSTQVPRWAAARGEVIVVEPRRVACRALALRVAELEGSTLGERVGFQVRGETQVSAKTVIRFVTPGIALQQMPRLCSASTVILDELHERRLDVDLLMAMLQSEAPQLVVMSATLEGQRVADHLGGLLLEGEGRTFPVDIRYRDEGQSVPSPRDLADRVARAIDETKDPGDVLVFLPGKSEIAATERALGRRDAIVTLHGGMSLDAQSRVFKPVRGRKIVLATNVAETSLTVPGIGVVIDSGLVRQTSYHHGRAHLALRPIAQDAADQRSGRAGRTGPGVAIRLWARRSTLETITPPEIHRESLVPLLLSAAACGHGDIESLPLLDPPKPHALADARAELRHLGGFDEEGALTSHGRELFSLPIDASLGRLLVEAKEADAASLQAMVDLVAVLASGRRLFVEGPPLEPPFRFDGCDAAGSVRAIRGEGGPVDAAARRESRTIAKRLRRALGLGPADRGHRVDGKALRDIALRADARSAYVVRRRGKGGQRVALANGGTELALGRESAAWKFVDPQAAGTKDVKAAEALVVWDVRAFGTGRERRLLATCVSPCPLDALRRFDLGEERLARTWTSGKGAKRRIMAEVERVLAGKVLGSRELVPEGELAREAFIEVMMRGSLFKKAIRSSKSRLRRRALAAQLSGLSAGRDHGIPEKLTPPPPFAEWLRERVRELGIESGDDVALLSDEDVLAEDLPFELQGIIESLYPMEVSLGDATYRVDYDLEKRTAILNTIKGGRTKPPARNFLPSFPGLKVFVEAGRRLHRV